MTTVGLKMEAEFFEALKKYFYIVQDRDLDRNGIDALVAGIKSATPLPMRHVLHVQATTRCSDLEKVFIFHRRMLEFGLNKSAYIEIDHETLTPNLTQMAVSAITALLLDEQSLPHTIVRVSTVGYKRMNMETVANNYHAWLLKKEERTLCGLMTYWRWQSTKSRNDQSFTEDDYEEVTGSIQSGQGYGFLEVMTGDGSKRGSVLRFFVSSRRTERTLLNTLMGFEGEIGDARIVVNFEDGGYRAGYSKKTAINVRIYPDKQPPAALSIKHET